MNSTRLTEVIILVAASLACACDTPDKNQKAADQARQEANNAVGQAQRDVDKTRIEANANVEQKQAQADISLISAKNDYRIKIASLITDADKKIGDLRAANVSASGTQRTKNDQDIAAVEARRERLGADAKQIDLTTAADWEALRAQIDKDATDRDTQTASAARHL